MNFCRARYSGTLVLGHKQCAKVFMHYEYMDIEHTHVKELIHDINSVIRIASIMLL
jgi:hypothetical protein